MKRVLLLLSNGFEAFEAAAFSDVLGFAGAFGEEEVEVITVGLRPELQCTFGFKVIPSLLLDEVQDDEFDAVAIPGGFENANFYEDSYSDEFLDVFRRFAAAGKPIAAVCTGGLPVARSGVLQGRRATTYHLLDGKRRKAMGEMGEMGEMGAIIVDEPIVRDGNFVTSTSPATATDVAFTLLGMLTSPQNVATTRHMMGFC